MSDVALSSSPAVSAIGLAVLSRCGDDSPSGAWMVAAACAGVAGADAFLCHLSRTISRALERLAASAASARVRARAARDAATAEGQSHLDYLESRIESFETSKRVALERELHTVDTVLEHLRAERVAASEAVATLSDVELGERLFDLTARLDAADAQLLALPTSVVEPPYVDVVVDEAALLAGAAVVGRVVAPRAITAADLTLESVPTHAYPGCSLLLRLVIRDLLKSSQSDEELDLSLGAAAAATHIASLLKCPCEGAAPKPLQAHISADISGCCIVVSIAVPLESPAGSSVCFGPLTVSGRPVAGLLGAVQVEPPGPVDLSPEHAAWLQSSLPPGGSQSPTAWKEVYRATTHGFGAAAFHERCDGQARLLVLVRAWEGGWLFGGFTAVGFSHPRQGYRTDHAAFLFSLVNSLGRPEKLEFKGTGAALGLSDRFAWSATFGFDFGICDNADRETGSYTRTGYAYAASAATGTHPMARGEHKGWLATEVVAWAV